jgi:hypothetical protein
MNNDMSWKQKGIFNVGTWNVQGIGHKDEQLEERLHNKIIIIAAISEIKKRSRPEVLNLFMLEVTLIQCNLPEDRLLNCC